ncbi:VOC family protein [bacterium]|nr:VOC family protein [bacterium]
MSNDPSNLSFSSLSFSSDSWLLDHVAYAVNNLDSAVQHYQKLFGLKLLFRGISEKDQIEAAFLGLANSAIELIAPLPGNQKIRKFLDTRGEGLHHLAFAVPSVAEELTRLTALGVELVDKVPRPGLRHHEIAFLHPRATGGVLIELCGK